MGKVVGYLLVLAGVSSGAYAVMPDTKLSGPEAAVSARAMATAPQAILAVRSENQANGVAAAAQVLSAKVPGQVIVAPAPQLAVRPATVPGQQVAQAVIPSAPALAQKSPDQVELVPKAVMPSKGKSSGAEDETRMQLARDIQRELKRVGCYSGDVNGEWTSGSRAAMNQFIERINATLPTDQPDHILKTLVQGHPGNACGKTCPAGQGLSNEGRCQPSAILAQQTAPRRPVPRATVAAREVDERPAVAQAPKAKPSGWETKVVTATPPAVVTAPVAAAPVVVAPAAVALAPRNDQPPGRMAVGAPAEATLDRADTNDTASNRVVTGSIPGSIPVIKPAAPRVAALPSPKVDRDSEADAPSVVRPDARRPVPPANVYVAPRPRYVAAPPQYYYPPQQVNRAPARERTTFGPRIFSQMSRDGR